jgi:ubiquinone/menaquinone biosynthesis C-methylase UbiE
MKDPLSHAAANEKKWDRRAATYDERRYGYHRLMQRCLICSLRLRPPVRLLDLGCGTGWAVRFAAAKLQGQGKFVGVDRSAGMVRRAKENARGIRNVEFQRADAEHLPFADTSFDAVLCSNSFHHYLHPENALREAERILKPAGRIYILDITADDFLVRGIDARVRRKEKEHVRFYSTREYDRLFLRSGLLHTKSSPLGIFYPLKVHVGVKRGRESVPPAPDIFRAGTWSTIRRS